MGREEIEIFAEPGNSAFGDVLDDLMSAGSAPAAVGVAHGDSCIVVFGDGPLRGYVAVTNGEHSELRARSMAEFESLVDDPMNHDEDGELVFDFDFIDAFAAGKRTKEDLAVGSKLLETLSSNLGDGWDEWDLPYVAQATWAAKLNLNSAETARELAGHIDDPATDSTPERWEAEAALQYLVDLKRWTEAQS
ncbi:hypothetical protein WG915_11380 [Corynebacterium sp. H128]|uniref:hypothetical protein n=1 Tax=Corynebacterium sp. H128 TaxID=3133427 RepID=UPI0030A4B1D2